MPTLRRALGVLWRRRLTPLVSPVPTLILADEPTANLDWETSLSIVNMLGRLATQQKRTIVMVTHDPQMATYASRKLFIRDGKLRDEDPVYFEALRQAPYHLPDETSDTEPAEAD